MRRLTAGLLVAIGTTAIVRATVVPWWQRWGRRQSDDGPLPGDDLVPDPTAVETRGIDIDAASEEIWPWLVQMGYGRAGWYSYDALDMNMPSANEIRPELGGLAIGDIMPTHPGGGFLVRIIDAPRALVLYSDVDVVRQQAEEAASRGAGDGPANIRATGALLEAAQPADFTASWAFVLEPARNGTTRLIERFRVRFGKNDKPWLAMTMPMMGFGVFLMMRKQMLGIRQRAEGLAHGGGTATAGVAPLGQPVA